MATLADIVTLGEPADYPWTIRRSDDNSLQFQVKLNGTGIDLTGATGPCKIRDTYASGATLLATATVSLVTAASGIVKAPLDESGSAIAIPAAAADDAATVRVGYYDLTLVQSGTTVCVLRGEVYVARKVA